MNLLNEFLQVRCLVVVRPAKFVETFQQIQLSDNGQKRLQLLRFATVTFPETGYSFGTECFAKITAAEVRMDSMI